ncbi:MAG TPA: uracil-DNA glycosylase, partial [Kribbella sp.]|nr:uracil-DNA glycosylase [Kribbella sp.]
MKLRHPLTGELFESPVPPGTGWPEDPAAPDTPVAHNRGEGVVLAATD